MPAINYRSGNDLNLDAVTELYRASTPGDRRPVDDCKSRATMPRSANLVISEWEGDPLVGLARSLTDNYPRIGFQPHANAWTLRPDEPLR
jgi:hypothetical protein